VRPETIAAAAESASAVFTLLTAMIAFYAARSWRQTLKNDRIDEGISAARDLRGAVNRCRSLITVHVRDQIWPAYRQTWESWRRLDKALAVLRRYDTKLDVHMSDKISQVLFRLEQMCREAVTEELEAIGSDISFMTNEIENTLA